MSERTRRGSPAGGAGGPPRAPRDGAAPPNDVPAAADGASDRASDGASDRAADALAALDGPDAPGPRPTFDAAPPATGAEARVRRFTLRVVDGGPGDLHRSRGERTIIGTHASAQLVLPDPTVSRFHCAIELDGARARLRDLDSRNGTLLDGVSIRDAWLRDGSLLTLGRTRLRFELGTDEVRVPLCARDRFGAMVGGSVAMRAAFAVLERAAASEATVLLEGETGTGKEVAAESIHRESRRREGPFVVVDCGAIPRDLLESELFGHERGAFTGATAPREGAFEAASGGTLFLDEIGELDQELQPKLLRVLERQEIKRVGTSRYRPVDVRVVAATNRDLRAEVNARRFRPDLYYRLAVLEVRLPALRERLDDLPALVDTLIAALVERGRAEPDAVAALRTPAFMAEVSAHAWLGNVRELRNYVERCLALRATVPLHAAAGPSGGAPASPTVDTRIPLREAREGWVRELERRYLAEVLRQHGDNVTAAARAASVDRIHFYRLLWRHGLR